MSCGAAAIGFKRHFTSPVEDPFPDFLAQQARRLGPDHISFTAEATGFDDGYRMLKALSEAHVIQPGETLSGIADRYGISIAEVMSLNGITDPDLIHAGESLSVGAQTAVVAPVLMTHLVVPGDVTNQQHLRQAATFGLGGIPHRPQVAVVQVLQPRQQHR